MSSTAMPIVWCSDPNSSNKQPIAFTLHGIQLEGNITEEHVTALKAMVNAATSGRMILPSDGAMVLLDCGIGLSSTIVQPEQSMVARAQSPSVTKKNARTHATPTQNAARKMCDKNLMESRRISLPSPLPPEPKYSDAPANELSKYDIIYEFLCCAKCMNDSTSTENMRNKCNLASTAAMRKCSSVVGKFAPIQKVTPSRRRCSDSFLFTSQRSRRIARTRHATAHAQKRWQQLKLIAESVPMYAEVNKQNKRSAIDSRLSASMESDKNIDPDTMSHRSSKDGGGRDREAHSRNLKCLNTASKQLTTTADGLSAKPEVIITRDGSGADDNDEANDSDHNIVTGDGDDDGHSKKASVNYPEQQPSRKASLDSGFNEMQNKLEKSTIANDEAAPRKMSGSSNGATITVPPIIITQPVTEKAKFLPGASDKCADDKCIETETAASAALAPAAASTAAITAPCLGASLKECHTQSRNRRKSYEEFKAIYHRDTIKELGPLHAAPIADANISGYAGDQLRITSQDKIRARRKSYEEFKAVVRECSEKENQVTSNPTNASKLSKCLSMTRKKFPKSNAEKLTKLNAKLNKAAAAAAALADTAGDGDAVSPKTVADCNEATMHSLTSTGGASTNKPINKEQAYKENFKIYNQLISYGTIYDIMQKKTDFYKACSKYDSYMTYGTIYEILQRKSDEYDVFRRKRAASEKFIGRRGSETADARLGKSDQGSINFGTIYDIIHRRTRSAEQSTIGSSSTIASAASASDNDTQKSAPSPRCYGKIYDILQNEKSDPPSAIGTGAAEKPLDSIRNRFMVKRVSEEDLNVPKASFETKDCMDEKPTQLRSNMYSEPVASPHSAKDAFRRERTRMRRFSNIVMPSCHRAGSAGFLGNITENDGLNMSANNGPLSAEVDYLFMGKKANASADEKCDKHRLSADHERLAAPLENPGQNSRHCGPSSLTSSPTAAANLPRKRFVTPHTANAGDQMQNKHNFAISVISRTNVSRDSLSPSGVDHTSNTHQLPHMRSNHANASANSDKCVGAGIAGGSVKDKCNMAKERAVKTSTTTKSRRLSEFTRGEFLNEKP